MSTDMGEVAPQIGEATLGPRRWWEQELIASTYKEWELRTAFPNPICL